MGAAASVKGMDREALAAEAERYRVPAAGCATIREHDIDGATALELAQLSDDRRYVCVKFAVAGLRGGGEPGPGEQGQDDARQVHQVGKDICIYI